jgi:hypothetical protein
MENVSPVKQALMFIFTCDFGEKNRDCNRKSRQRALVCANRIFFHQYIFCSTVESFLAPAAEEWSVLIEAGAPQERIYVYIHKWSPLNCKFEANHVKFIIPAVGVRTVCSEKNSYHA